VKPDLAPRSLRPTVSPAGAGGAHRPARGARHAPALLHPIMPFVTEELWQKFPHTGTYLSTSHWPSRRRRASTRARAGHGDAARARRQDRNVRAEAGIDPSRRIEVLVHAETRERAAGREQARSSRPGRARSESPSSGVPPTTSVSARGVVRGSRSPCRSRPAGLRRGADAADEGARQDRRRARRAEPQAGQRVVPRARAGDVVEKERAIQQEFLEKKRRIESTLRHLGEAEARVSLRPVGSPSASRAASRRRSRRTWARRGRHDAGRRSADPKGDATLVAREPMVVAGLAVARKSFASLDATLVHAARRRGDRVGAGAGGRRPKARARAAAGRAHGAQFPAAA
jgi:hypothetical protein